MPDPTSTTKKLDKAIDKGIEYLLDHQLPNGEFLIYMSGDDAMQGWNLPESSVFPASLIGTCLLPLKDHKNVQKILLNSAGFLQYQMDRGGTWNHYTILQRFRNLCPQDLDVTACTSYFLRALNIDIPTKRNQQLILDNRRSSDGLFYTWLIFRFKLNRNLLYWYFAAKELKHLFKSIVFWYKFECSRYDVDAVVNANILFYLGKRKETQPIISHLIHVIKENKETTCDKWYLNPLTIYYFISRNYHEGIIELEEIRSSIIDRILLKHQKNGSYGESDLDAALAILSLIYLKYNGPEVLQGLHYLMERQLERGNWKRWAFYYTGPKGSGLGSEELTTAYCLEALSRFKDLDYS